jgi:hypothetical protein
VRLKRHVGKQPVITQGDAETGCQREEAKHDELKGIDSVEPEIKRHSGAGNKGGPD